MLRAGQSPAARDREDREMAESRIEQVAAAALQASRADPLAHARPLALEQLVEVARRDEARAGDSLRIEIGVAEVRRDERLDVVQDLRARSHALRPAARSRARRTCLARGRATHSTVFGASPAVIVPSSSPPTSPRKNATAARGTPSLPGILSAVQPADPVCVPAEQLIGTRTTSDSNGSFARNVTGCDVS